MAKVTVRSLDALKPRPGKSKAATTRGYKVTVDRGLYLRVADDGTKSWLVRYVVDGVQTQVRLPKPYASAADEGHMSLAQALAENARIQALARDGIDFQRQREDEELARAQAAHEAAAANKTFRSLFEAWLIDGVSRKDGNAELRRSFEKDLFPVLGELPARDVDDVRLGECIRQIGRVRARPRAAERLLSEVRQLYRWALRRPAWRAVLVHGNPAELVELKQVVTEGYLPPIRQRTLSAKEIRELFDVLEVMTGRYSQAKNKRSAPRPLLPETQEALWLCLATGCRIGELLMSRWEDVHLENAKWFVPRQNTKTRVDWLVFLSDFAVRHFEKLRSLSGDSEWCFPSRLAEGHVSVKSVTKQVGDRQMRFKCRKPLSRRRNDDSLVLDGGRQGEWTPHDLRRTAATMMQALGVNPDVIDRCQNHVLPGSKVRRHYLLHDYAEEKRRAWQLLGQRLETILGDGNVLQLVRKA